ncbi:hypothetical protein J3R30DRAFT_3403284 [Lentinula aciculospora]|uniref:Uncharacterized protein n=1 Tax=Lentinula aciculospora TaxID=153920 RepID=A0A9W9DQR5_9AGAR|nr:hypothetical protein J3R30DRAFT_3403284 [Lentinula aciculospora]
MRSYNLVYVVLNVALAVRPDITYNPVHVRFVEPNWGEPGPPCGAPLEVNAKIRELVDAYAVFTHSETEPILEHYNKFKGAIGAPYQFYLQGTEFPHCKEWLDCLVKFVEGRLTIINNRPGQAPTRVRTSVELRSQNTSYNFGVGTLLIHVSDGSALLSTYRAMTTTMTITKKA